MARRTLTETVAQNVSAAIKAADVSPAVVAEAADLTTPDLLDRLRGVIEFSVPELVKVGGFLRVRPSEFLAVAA